MNQSPRSSKPVSSPSVPLRDWIADTLSRRSFVQNLTGAACAGALLDASTTQSKADVENSAKLFDFKAISVSSLDDVIVPEGYVAQVLYRWGDPIDGVQPAFRPDASNSAADQALQAGMGHDGMEYFAIPGKDPNATGLLCVNHEYTDQVLLYADGIDPLPPAKMPMEKIQKSIASHGISVVQIEKQPDGTWKVVPSKYARRITADTPATISGPAKTKIGSTARGTVNNCAAGRTPWGTYLTCEENFQGIFGTNDPSFQPNDLHKAYGLSSTGFYYTIDGKKVPAYRWWEGLKRFDLAEPDNDSERFGYVVEIDPLQPDAAPIKRTALGRIKHENAEVVVAPSGQVVVYMGDDESDQYIYKFVSAGTWDASSNPNSGLPASSDLLDRGTLYVAKFNDDGTGLWLELAPGKHGIPTKSDDSITGFDDADICVYTLLAAKLAGATPMDRPEWLSVHPTTHEVYVSLTNNKSRHATDGANPRPKNIYGHIVRWNETENDSAARTFRWQVFVLAGNPKAEDPSQQGTAKGDFFACPDGIKFDRSGILWIQTDISTSVLGASGFAEFGHNMMLAANPSTGETRRFLTGPRGCEITGNAMTPDRTTMFVNIQHPGEPSDELSDPKQPQKVSSWPDGPQGGRPRSATLAIRRLDGKTIGS